MRARFSILFLAALLFAAGVGAQKGRPDLQPLPEPPPPPAVSDPELEPQVTIRKKDGDTIE